MYIEDIQTYFWVGSSVVNCACLWKASAANADSGLICSVTWGNSLKPKSSTLGTLFIFKPLDSDLISKCWTYTTPTEVSGNYIHSNTGNYISVSFWKLQPWPLLSEPTMFTNESNLLVLQKRKTRVEKFRENRRGKGSAFLAIEYIHVRIHT